MNFESKYNRILGKYLKSTAKIGDLRKKISEREKMVEKSESFRMAAWAWKKKSEELQDELRLARNTLEELRRQRSSWTFKLIQPAKWIISTITKRKVT